MKTKIYLIFLILSCVFLQGCILAAAGAGIGAISYGHAKSKEADAKNMDSYNQYVLGMEKINTDRQEKGLQPVKIMSYQEYLSSKN